MNHNELYQLLFDAAPDAIIVVNTKGHITLCNNQVQQLFGYSKEELLDQPVECLIPKRFTKEHKDYRDSYSKKPTVRAMGAMKELLAKRKDGSEFFVEVSLSPINISSELHVSASIRDVSEKISMNRQLKQSLIDIESKSKELEQFAYIASHDLQEPLRTVISFTELLAKNHGKEFDETAQNYMRFISEATVRMSQLIKGLLDYSRIGRNRELSKVDCNKLLEDLQVDLASAIADTKATITVSELPKIKGYETELRMLFQNLLTNAIKFRKPETSPMITVSAEKKSGSWEFTVKDNGIGISDEHKERIFIIFQRLHKRDQYEGTGIGLAHCRKIVQLHGGKIWVDSQVNKGSSFHFTITN